MLCVFSALLKAVSQHKQTPDLRKPKNKTCENRKSKPAKIESQDLRKSPGNNTDFSKTDLPIYPAQPNPIDVIERYREQIKENIEYDHLIQQYPYDDLDEIVDLMLEVLCTQEDFVKIGKKQVFTALARERFLKLDSSHIEYVIDCLRNTPSDIRNIKAYLLETLFNAPATSGNYYKAKVNYDFHGTG